MGITDDFQTNVFSFQGTPVFSSFSKSKSPVLGITVEFEPLKTFSIEVNGLYRPLHLTSENLTSIPGESIQAGEGLTVTVLTWEFPLLAKYKVSLREVTGFAELGPAFRARGNLNGTKPSRYGITGGTGVEISLRKMKISPGIRYTRWATDDTLGTRTNPDQVELVVGFSF